ncbi:hypothetical protein [Baekduia soli]|uniref:hypothetical protein n=1 Tax=Baekduia soli TaxID=496014 RepID=UPI001652B4AF|nr:hypothetical protein [Baekduia soli]
MPDDPEDDDIPTGMPDGQPEEAPLGVAEADPEGEHTEPGPGAMPGIPTEGEPPAVG